MAVLRSVCLHSPAVIFVLRSCFAPFLCYLTLFPSSVFPAIAKLSFSHRPLSLSCPPPELPPFGGLSDVLTYRSSDCWRIPGGRYDVKREVKEDGTLAGGGGDIKLDIKREDLVRERDRDRPRDRDGDRDRS
eukprot:3204342-Rhodomonas_salina.1